MTKIYARSIPFLIFAVSLFLNVSCRSETPAETPAQDSPPTVTSPAAPTALRLAVMTENSVTLRWIDASTNETSFIIEQGLDSINFSSVLTVEPNRDSATISASFLTTKTYYFRIKAKNSAFTSGASNIVWRTLFPPPSNFSIAALSASSVSITWSDNSDNETGFIIERSIDASAYSVIDSAAGNSTAKIIAGTFDSAKTYSFRVYAKSDNRTSGYSNAAARSLGPWIFVSGGTFTMGSSDQFKDERPMHNVTLSSFYISKYEVTVKEYRQYTVATNRPFPSAPPWGWNDNSPIINVSWNDAKAYCLWLDSTTGKRIRLPTEAEWEYAARGGKNSQGFRYSGSNNIDLSGWYYLNSSGQTMPCGQKKPNEIGVYDMSGNAWEWCSDWYGSYSSSPQINPTGPAGGTNKVFRGGSWFDYGLSENECRSMTRYSYTPNGKVSDGGLRIVKAL